eukprot:scaffold1809_cov111-Isochrysis_galbana.AAC.3
MPHLRSHRHAELHAEAGARPILRKPVHALLCGPMRGTHVGVPRAGSHQQPSAAPHQAEGWRHEQRLLASQRRWSPVPQVRGHLHRSGQWGHHRCGQRPPLPHPGGRHRTAHQTPDQHRTFCRRRENATRRNPVRLLASARDSSPKKMTRNPKKASAHF